VLGDATVGEVIDVKPFDVVVEAVVIELPLKADD
jgi:hypothetical protein